MAGTENSEEHVNNEQADDEQASDLQALADLDKKNNEGGHHGR
ncbi:hypothetical protein [Streptomyces sp. NPDC059819]